MTEHRSLIPIYAKELRLPSFTRYPQIVREAEQGHFGYEEFLLRMMKAELANRQENQRKQRIRQAKLPLAKTLDTFEFGNLPKLDPALIWHLAVCSFQPTRAPKLSAMNLAGTNVRPPTIVGGTSSVTLAVLTVADGLSICRVMVVSALLPVIVRVASFHSTDAPKASKIERSGTKVRPLLMTGGTSITSALPFTTTLMGCSANPSEVVKTRSIATVTADSLLAPSLNNGFPPPDLRTWLNLPSGRFARIIPWATVLDISPIISNGRCVSITQGGNPRHVQHI